MENDSIRASGTDTLVDIWIDGKIRAITVAQEAIGSYLDFDRLAGMTDDDRCAFVKNNLGLVHSAARTKLRGNDPAAAAVTLDAGDFPRPDGKETNRRKTERRKSDRRKASRPLGGQPDRRRTDRRHGERRSRPPKPES